MKKLFIFALFAMSISQQMSFAQGDSRHIRIPGEVGTYRYNEQGEVQRWRYPTDVNQNYWRSANQDETQRVQQYQGYDQ